MNHRYGTATTRFGIQKGTHNIPECICPIDLATPAGPAVAAARSGSLAEAWHWTPEDEEAYQLMMNELHAKSESTSSNAETASVQSYAMDANEYKDAWHDWHDPQP